MSPAVLELTSLRTPVPESPDVTNTAPAPVLALAPEPTALRCYRKDHEYSFVGLKDLTKQEESLAYQASIGTLEVEAAARLQAIESELDRRWALYR